MNKSWFDYAKEASQKVGWFPTVIVAQWQLETGNFKSYNFLHNNNIAGQTWTPRMPLSMRGSARPKNEGGYYIRYLSPVDGYTDFILNNHRYDGVKAMKTEEDQIKEIARQGWATDEHYAEKLIATLHANRTRGITLPMLDKTIANLIIDTLIGPAWKAVANQKDRDKLHAWANELRTASGQPEQQK